MVIYWCDSGEVAEDYFENYEGIPVCAAKLRWRAIENRMGQEEFYVASK